MFGQNLVRKIASLRGSENNPDSKSDNFGIKDYSTSIHSLQDPNLLNQISQISTDNSDLILDNKRKIQFPRKTHLTLKVSRRCKKCNQILIKPDTKPQSVRFKINQTAIRYVPKISIPIEFAPNTPIFRPEFLDPLYKSNHTSQEFLMPVRFTNPLNSPVVVSIEPLGNHVNIYPQKFKIKEYVDQWDFDEIDLKKSHDLELEYGFGDPSFKNSLAFQTDQNISELDPFDKLQLFFRQNMHSGNGILSRRKNSSLILFGINQSNISNGYKIPFKVSFHAVEDQINDDTDQIDADFDQISSEAHHIVEFTSFISF
ncbi:Dynactin subunit 4 [Smittium mucronatum]|uniref:Dynactin subunit 4 n=1 Tax=Smittium mucronatum TaxID=133383 RepID=A0A1R0GV35_9FUNG|nr:Dynactin subunit 4 [Smittium mucronatum]